MMKIQIQKKYLLFVKGKICQDRSHHTLTVSLSAAILHQAEALDEYTTHLSRFNNLNWGIFTVYLFVFLFESTKQLMRSIPLTVLVSGSYALWFQLSPGIDYMINVLLIVLF